MIGLGFKTLTKDNWLEPDNLHSSGIFATVSSDGSVSTLTADDWVNRFLQPSLTDNVPLNVRRLFEVARGALLYGYFFYPLHTLGFEQLLRAAESAAVAKCVELGAPAALLESNNFPGKLQFLKKRAVLSEQEFFLWKTMHKHRNDVCHPKEQHLIAPGSVAGMLGVIAETINKLFP